MLDKMRISNATKIVEQGASETLSYYYLPGQHWRSLHTNNPLEWIMREIKRRTKAVGAFPDGESVLMQVAARLRHIARSKWGTKRYMNFGLRFVNTRIRGTAHHQCTCRDLQKRACAYTIVLYIGNRVKKKISLDATGGC